MGLRKDLLTGRVKHLLMGDEMRVMDKAIVIGPARVIFDRLVTEEDIEAVLIVYTMGAAAKARFVAESFNTFVGTFTPIEITGYEDPGPRTEDAGRMGYAGDLTWEDTKL